MPEQVYRDLTPDMSDIPPETWAGIDAKRLGDFIVKSIPEGVEPADSLRGMIRQTRLQAPSEELRRKAWLSPRLVKLIDEAVALEKWKNHEL